MNYKTLMVKYGEIGVKGKNKYVFEDALLKQMRIALNHVEGEFKLSKEAGRVYVEMSGNYDYNAAVDTLSRVFGIVAICPMLKVENKDFDNLKAVVVEYVKDIYKDKNYTFKVQTRRVDKQYPMNSEEISAELGHEILENCDNLKVDVRNPEVLIKLEIRNHINIYSESIKGPGGMPVGTNGKAMLLLSGGIDSPVAGYMVAKRGVKVEAVYFHAPPYTSERAKQKVLDLASIVARYAGPINLHIVNFTDIQLYIYENCPHDELTIIMRRYMMKIAEKIAVENEDLALITGESIGQVASQTVHSLAATNEVCNLPVFRPLIGFDKQEIIDIAEKIGSFETSIEPYGDCCTIFVAKHPVTKPNIDKIKNSELNLQEKIDDLVEKAIKTKDRVLCSAKRH